MAIEFNITGSKRFGTMLAGLRHAAKMTQKLAAAKCGTSTNLWCMFETGRRRPTADHLFAMSLMFDRPMDKLYRDCSEKRAAATTERVSA